jgi:hypothetical protein
MKHWLTILGLLLAMAISLITEIKNRLSVQPDRSEPHEPESPGVQPKRPAAEVVPSDGAFTTGTDRYENSY